MKRNQYFLTKENSIRLSEGVTSKEMFIKEGKNFFIPLINKDHPLITRNSRFGE